MGGFRVQGLGCGVLGLGCLGVGVLGFLSNHLPHFLSAPTPPLLPPPAILNTPVKVYHNVSGTFSISRVEGFDAGGRDWLGCSQSYGLWL